MPKQVITNLTEAVTKREQNIKVLLKSAKDKLTEENYELLKRYDQWLVIQSLSNTTRYTQLITFVSLTSKYIQGKWEWKDVDQAKLMELCKEIMVKHAKNGKETQYTYTTKLILRKIVRFVVTGNPNFDRNNGELDMLKFLNSMKKPKSELTKEQLPTKEELSKLIDACADSSRDKALFSLHAESGNRIEETLTLKIKNFRIDEFGGIIEVSGKTGTRTVRIVKSVPYVAKWLNDHPYRDDKEYPLFILIDQSNTFGNAMSYASFQFILKKRLKMAGITKRTTSHLFRHSAVTEWASKLTESESRMRFGWTRNSPMPMHYAHLNQDDLDRKVLESYGIKPKIVEENPINECNYCKIKYPSETTFCEQCSRPIDLETAIQMEKESKSNQEALILELIRKEKSAERKRKSIEGTQQVVKKQQEEIELLKQTIQRLSK